MVIPNAQVYQWGLVHISEGAPTTAEFDKAPVADGAGAGVGVGAQRENGNEASFAQQASGGRDAEDANERLRRVVMQSEQKYISW
jgi:hypothetical protein